RLGGGVHAGQQVRHAQQAHGRQKDQQRTEQQADRCNHFNHRAIPLDSCQILRRRETPSGSTPPPLQESSPPRVATEHSAIMDTAMAATSSSATTRSGSVGFLTMRIKANSRDKLRTAKQNRRLIESMSGSPQLRITRARRARSLLMAAQFLLAIDGHGMDVHHLAIGRIRVPGVADIRLPRMAIWPSVAATNRTPGGMRWCGVIRLVKEKVPDSAVHTSATIRFQPKAITVH